MPGWEDRKSDFSRYLVVTLAHFLSAALCIHHHLVAISLYTQGSGNPGAPELDDPMDQEGGDDKDNDKDGDGEEEETKEDEDEGAVDDEEEEKRRAEGEEEPPAFGVEGDGGDSAVLEAAKEEVRIRRRVTETGTK